MFICLFDCVFTVSQTFVTIWKGIASSYYLILYSPNTLPNILHTREQFAPVRNPGKSMT